MASCQLLVRVGRGGSCQLLVVILEGGGSWQWLVRVVEEGNGLWLVVVGRQRQLRDGKWCWQTIPLGFDALAFGGKIPVQGLGRFHCPEV